MGGQRDITTCRNRAYQRKTVRIIFLTSVHHQHPQHLQHRSHSHQSHKYRRYCFRFCYAMMAAVYSNIIVQFSRVVANAHICDSVISSSIVVQSSAVHCRAVARKSAYFAAPTLRSNATTSSRLFSIARLRGVLPSLQARRVSGKHEKNTTQNP